MENQANLNLNTNTTISSKIPQVGDNKKQVLSQLKQNIQSPSTKTFWKIQNLRKYALKSLAGGLLVFVFIKPSIVENFFNAFDFSKRKKDRTENRTIRFPKEDYGNLVQSVEDNLVSFEQISDDRAMYYTDILKFEKLFESDLNLAKLDLLERIIEKRLRIKVFEKEMKSLSQDYFKESEKFKNILKSVKKSEVSSEEFEKINLLNILADNNSKSFFNSQKSRVTNVNDTSNKIDLFSFEPSKNLKNFESEIPEFIGNLNNNDIIKQYYVVENLKSKINNSFNQNIENNINKNDLEKSFKKYDNVAQSYYSNRNKLMEDYVKDYKDIDEIHDNQQLELFYNNSPVDLVNNYLRTYYEKYTNLFKELKKKVEDTNNVDNIIKFNRDNKEILSKFEKIAFDFKDSFIQRALEKSKCNTLKIYSQIELKNELEKIKLELIDRIYRDWPKKAFGSFFVNRLYNNIILPNYKEMSPLLYLWFNNKNPAKKLSSGISEFKAIVDIDYAIQQNDCEKVFELLNDLKEHKDLTKDFERKLSYHLKSQLIFDIVSEHSKI